MISAVTTSVTSNVMGASVGAATSSKRVAGDSKPGGGPDRTNPAIALTSASLIHQRRFKAGFDMEATLNLRLLTEAQTAGALFS